MNLILSLSLKRQNFLINTISRLSKKSYTDSIHLPKTNFPLRLANQKLIERDKHLNKLLNSNTLNEWQKSSASEFILHDGPPYANGSPHMGHAINKILKDIILRSAILDGKKVHYVPGWDCHGLPIELKAIKDNSSLKEPLEIRKRAREFANEAIIEQNEVFQSWGILGNWNNPYKTFNTDYIINQYRQIFNLYTKNLVYRDFKPIYWSPSTKTALAESELEYKEDHVSESIYVRFRIEDMPEVAFLGNKPIYALIWTTTPWTIPSNQAVCFNSELTYCFCTKDSGKTIFIAAIELIEELKKMLNCEIEMLATLPDELLTKLKYRHPIYKDRVLPFIAGTHVNATKGTGLVHTAPAHGPEDFLVALSNKIPIINLVNDEGCYTDEAGVDLKGKFVLDEGNKSIIRMLNEDVVHTARISHSYPYDWRTKKPVIIRASEQWFLNTDHVKERAIESLDKVTFWPTKRSSIYKEEFLKQILKRPFWCISRQRKWGVPIPVFYNKDDNQVFFNEDIINHQIKLLEEHGSDYWWSFNEEKLLPKQDIDPSKYRKGEDIFDIWFDSGISWSNVLGNDKIADLYLEGGDQLNGWFYSSLITSLASRDVAPYKSIYIHGFAVDEKGLKMSKSIGNVVNPVDITSGKKPYGIDTLRWWVACHADQDSLVPISDRVLQSCADEVHRIRSVLRFILGALKDYRYENEKDLKLLLLDRYILNILSDFHNKAKQDYKEYAFNRIGKTVIKLLSNEISALYYPAIKDRLYCDLQNSPIRKSAQYTLFQILEIVSMSIAPILPHLVEELYMHLSSKNEGTFFTSLHKQPDESWKNDEIKELMEMILNIRKNLNLQVGSNSSTMDVNVVLSEQFFEKAQSLVSVEDLSYEIAHICQCANVIVSKRDQIEDYQLKIARSTKCLCPRCRRLESNREDELCERCTNVMNNSLNKESLRV